jgi:DNA-binding Lrp family transcriptional regulator
MEHMSVSDEPLLEQPRAGELHVDQLEDADRELLNAVQWDFPLEPRPYLVLAERLGGDEAEVRARIARVKELGVLRQLSAIFDTRALGYGSSLVAAKIDPGRVDEAAAVILSTTTSRCCTARRVRSSRGSSRHSSSTRSASSST